MDNTSYFKQLTALYDRTVPFHRFLCGPNLPTSYLYRPDSSYGDSVSVVVAYDSNGKLTSVTGTNASSVVALIELTYDQPNKKITVDFKKSGITEFQIVETYSTSLSKLTLELKCPSNSALNSKIDVTLPSKPYSNKNVSMTIDINSTTISGSFNPQQDTVPQIYLDLISQINGMTGYKTVAAFETRMMSMLAMDYLRQQYNQLASLWDTINTCASIASDIHGGVSTIASFMVCSYITEFIDEFA